jgi:hypothetical protein
MTLKISSWPLYKFSQFLIMAGLVSTGLGLSVPVRAADLAFQTRLNITQKQENLYAAGALVEVVSPVTKDLTVAGGNVRIVGAVERNLTVAGSDVEINAPQVGGSTKIIGARVKLSGFFNEDVVIVAGQLDISGATIQGDLILNVGTLKMQDSKVGRDLIGSYTTSDGDLRAQVQGSVDLRREPSKVPSPRDLLYYVNPAAEVSAIAGLLLIVYILNQKKRLLIRSLKLDKEMGLDLLAGLLYLVLPVILLVISVILQLYPLVLTLGAIIYLLFGLSSLFTPVYLASLVKNVWRLKTDLRLLVLLSYLGLLALNIISKVIPFLDFLQIVIFIATLGGFGFLMRRLLSVVYNYINAG